MTIFKTQVADPRLLGVDPTTNWPTYAGGPQKSLPEPDRLKRPRRGTAHRELAPRAVAWAVVLLMIIVESAWSVIGEPLYPAVSAIQPLPTGDEVVLDVTFPPRGAEHDGTRVLIVAIPAGVKLATGLAAISHGLQSRGWDRSMCDPKDGLCAIVGCSMADLYRDYGVSSTSASVRRLETVAHRRLRPSVMISLAHE
jgi:hypothetical protein